MASSRGYRIALMGIKQSQKEMQVEAKRSNNLENVENNINIINITHLNLSAANDESKTISNNLPGITSRYLEHSPNFNIITENQKSLNEHDIDNGSKVLTIIDYSPSPPNSSTPNENPNHLDTPLLDDIDSMPIIFLENECSTVSPDVLLNNNFDDVLNEASTFILNEIENYSEIGVIDEILVEKAPENKQRKLVNYSSSSESNNSESEPVRKSKKLKRFDSDYSFDEKKESDFFYSSSDSEDAVEKSTVGESGLRKPRKANKKKIKQIEKCLGATKSVQENPCKNTKCQNSCATNFTEKERHDIFEFYWGLGSHQRQRDWLLSCIKETVIKRRRVTTEISRRNRTFKYIITLNGTEIEVCQKFLLKTLCISQMTLRYTKDNAFTEKFAKTDQRGKHDPPHKTNLEDKKSVHDFIKKLPAVPSHYCRGSTTKKYLPAEMRNVSFLYRIFIKDQQEFFNVKTKVSLKVFRNIFNKDFNLGFHLPKKDKCSLCEARKDNGLKFTKEEVDGYEAHVRDKDVSKQHFLSDQKLAKEDTSFVCASFDLQKVLNTPHGDNMLLYYSRKYAMYNETIYESGTCNTFCYVWGENDGNRGSNEVGTILNKYLEMVDQRGNVQTVALYCDSCSGQNKNKAILAMIYKFLKSSNNIQDIKIVFLLPGHTYMPVDAVHATIERFISKRIVWAPSEWATLISNARVNPRPFEVISMKYSDFVDWKTTADNLLSSNKTNDGQKFKISQLRIAYFKKGEDSINIKYSYSDSVEKLVLPLSFVAPSKGRRSKKSPKVVDVLYSSPLPISEIKLKNLMELCEKRVIPQRYWDEYKSLVAKVDVPDTLAETDNEDEIREEN